MADADRNAPAVIQWRVMELENDLRGLQARLEGFEKEVHEKEKLRQQQERRNLIAGIGALGSIITTLGGIIWTYRSVIFAGKS